MCPSNRLIQFAAATSGKSTTHSRRYPGLRGLGELFQHTRRHVGGTAFHAADRLLLAADFFGEFGLAHLRRWRILGSVAYSAVQSEFGPRTRNEFLAEEFFERSEQWECVMHGIIYLVGLVIVVMAVLSVLGLR